jgi:hypothetical protein
LLINSSSRLVARSPDPCNIIPKSALKRRRSLGGVAIPALAVVFIVDLLIM